MTDNIPNLDDILKNPDDFFDLEDDLEKYDPSQFYSYNNMMDEADQLILKKDLGPALYYLSLILKVDGLNYRNKSDEELKKIGKDMAVSGIRTVYILMSMDLSEQIKDIDDKEKIALMEKYSSHYQKYLRLKEKFGTDYTPSI